MFTRFTAFWFLLVISFYSQIALAASCSAVFPSALQSNQLGSGNELTNIPVNNSTNNLTAGTVLPRGNNFYLGSALGNRDSISVGAITGSEITARLYFSSSVSWQNVKINEFGNPEDLIIIVDGALHLTGGNTVINAIIYVKGAADSNTITGNITINGSFTDLGATSITHASINYQQSYINNADFNGMCTGALPVVPLANYQFDECAYTGSGNEVVDQTTIYSGTSHGGVNTSDVSKIGRSLNLLDYTDHVETSIPLPASYSVSAWFKKPTSTSNSQYFVLGAMGTGGDLLYLDRLNGWRWGVYNGASNIDGSYSFASLDSNWHHLTLVYQSNVTKLYIDGVYTDSVNTTPSGTLKYIGTSFDGVNTTSAQGFRAPLDEFIVYNNALLATQVQSIYNSQSIGNNYDGSQRAIISCATLIANFRLDECVYTGAANEVIDQLGSYAATSFSGVDTFASGKIERASNFSNYSHHLETSILLPTKYSVSAWVKKPTSTTDSRYFILGSMQAGGDLLYLDRNNSWRWGVYNGTSSIDGSYSFASLDSNWHHLALVYQNNETKLYVDGVFVDSINTMPSGILKYIGTSFDSIGTVNAQGFRAPIDEFMVYSGVLSSSEISTIYTNQLAGNNHDGSTRAAVSCTINIDHYQIEHDGNGLTCSAEPVIIKACTDNLCNTLSTDAVTLDFQGNGTTISSPTFTGSTTVNFNHTVAETLTLSVANPTITPTNALVCNNGSTTSCDMVFADTGFRFLVDGAVGNIPTQLSGKPSNTGYHSASLALQAIKTNSVTGACEAALTSNVVVELAAKCTNPTTCAGQAVNVNGTNIATLDNTASLTYTNINFDFGSNTTNSAGFTFTYPDAGRVQFYARYNIPVNGLPSGNFMSGTSNGFVVRPLGFYVDVVGNTAAQTATQGVFKKAGQAFTTTIKAMQWQSGDDTNNDAKPDSNALLSNNIATPNFGNELAAESVVISNSLVAPTGGNNPALNNNIFSSFIAGVATKSNLSWNEVGILKFDANLADNQYIGTSDIINTVPYVGRFIPDHFTQTVVTQGRLTGTCGAGSWVYSGQKDEATQLEGAISYATEPKLQITAYNANGSTVSDITQNYTTTGGEGFMRLLNTGISMTTPTTDLNQAGVTTTTTLTGTIDAGTLVQSSAGVLDYTLAPTDDFTYSHDANAKINPYQAEIPLAVASITDQDGVIATSTEQAVPTGVEIRFGRMVLANSFGPETANLAQPLSVEYWNNGNFVINIDDNCSSFDSAKVSLSNISLVPNGLAAVVSGLFVKGVDSTIELKATGAGNQGQIGVSYSTFPWLQYDWNKDSVHNNNPDAVATFGLFRGNDRVIYWREVNN